MKTIVIVLVLLLASIAGGAALYSRYAGGGEAPKFRTAEVTRGDLQVTIDATGTVQAEERVDVGAQVVGKIKALGPDVEAAKAKEAAKLKEANTPKSSAKPAAAKPADDEPKEKYVDFTSHVEKDAVLAIIDDAIYLAQRNQAKAALERAKADLLQLRARRDLAAADWRRAQELRGLQRSSLVPAGLANNEPARPFKAIADSDYDLAKANYGAAEANVKVGEAAVEQQDAALQLAETNLGYTVIRSPVKGTIIDRRVDVGQTVVASLNAPSLFLIAKDLTRIEVWVAVNEKDIGQIKTGMPVRFKVDAHADVFFGKVSQVRLNANMTQNVVIYTVIVTAENKDLALLPYMSANVKFDVEKRTNVLRVPNIAVRWQPKPEQVVSGFDETGARKDGKEPGEKRAGGSPPAAEWASREMDQGNVWVMDGALVRPIKVKIGPSDGTLTEISGEGIHEGLAVVVGQPRAEAASEAVVNPLIPSMPRRGRNRPQ